MRTTTSSRRFSVSATVLHRRAAGRQLIDDRNVEIGVRRHRQRARNRRRGHDQLMRKATGEPALLAQQQALMHAEAMLLVDDHQAEALELDAFLEQRVRADRDLRGARREIGQRARARRRVALAGQQSSAAGRMRRTTSRSCARAARPAIPSAPSPPPESRLPLHARPRAPRRRFCRSPRRLAPAAASDWAA